MPGTYVVDAERRLVVSRGWGVLEGGELLSHARGIAADSRFEPSFRQLADLRAVTGASFGLATIRELASLNPFGPGARRAVVIQNDVAYGVIRMYQMVRDLHAQDLFVFREVDPAIEWLDLAEHRAAILAMLEPTQSQ